MKHDHMLEQKCRQPSPKQPTAFLQTRLMQMLSKTIFSLEKLFLWPNYLFLHKYKYIFSHHAFLMSAGGEFWWEKDNKAWWQIRFHSIRSLYCGWIHSHISVSLELHVNVTRVHYLLLPRRRLHNRSLRSRYHLSAATLGYERDGEGRNEDMGNTGERKKEAHRTERGVKGTDGEMGENREKSFTFATVHPCSETAAHVCIVPAWSDLNPHWVKWRF